MHIPQDEEARSFFRISILLLGALFFVLMYFVNFETSLTITGFLTIGLAFTSQLFTEKKLSWWKLPALLIMICFLMWLGFRHGGIYFD